MLTNEPQQILPLHRIAHLAQELLHSRLSAGDLVMDATMGNGHDTLFLWKRVQPTGKVIAFDVQPQAISSTKALLLANGWDGTKSSIDLVLESHRHFTRYIDRPLKAVMFNLGYLPGSDRKITTNWSEMKPVMDLLVNQHLAVGACVSIVSYPGHQAGKAEQTELLRYVRKLPSKTWGVLEIVRSNVTDAAPMLIIIEKKE